MSERRACRVVGQARCTQRFAPSEPDDDKVELRRWLVAFTREHPRGGGKRAYHQLRREGRRVQRLWRLDGLKVPYRKRKKPLRSIGTQVGAMVPIRPHVVWSLDFQFDQTRDGRTLKLLNVVDEFTRECLAIEVARSITADDVTNLLDRLVAERGVPCYLRSDNGPEFAADAIRDWCTVNGSATVFIDPGSPWQNAWIESFNSRLRDEFLNGQLFDSLLEAQVLLADWCYEYNHLRLHSSLGYLTPVEFNEAWNHQHQQRLLLAMAH